MERTNVEINNLGDEIMEQQQEQRKDASVNRIEHSSPSPANPAKRRALHGHVAVASPGKHISEAAKLTFSNFDFDVMDSDMHELLGKFGPHKSARPGRADLLERQVEAAKAIKQSKIVPQDEQQTISQLASSDISALTRLATTARAAARRQSDSRLFKKPETTTFTKSSEKKKHSATAAESTSSPATRSKKSCPMRRSSLPSSTSILGAMEMGAV